MQIPDLVPNLTDASENRERHPPTHIPHQADLIGELFDTDDPVWMLFFDGGRFDFFDQLCPDYFEGTLRRVYNGGVGYTGDWAMAHLRRDFGNRGLFSWLPLRDHQYVEYDGREWFSVATDIGQRASVRERLATLGYAELKTAKGTQVASRPESINTAVREQAQRLNGGVIRYLKPHPPFEGLENITSGSSKTAKTQQALDAGKLTYAELTDAYRRTYERAFESAVGLVPDLDGRVVITADHGTCLTCGQLFHGRQLDKHDHLTIVPWFEVGDVK